MRTKFVTSQEQVLLVVAVRPVGTRRLSVSANAANAAMGRQSHH